VCGESDLGLGGCSGVVTWPNAKNFCESAGARLCTVTELQADEARGTGCGLDTVMSWTSDSCGIGFMVAPGSTRLTTEPSCETASSDTKVRCCADVKKSSPVPAPTKGPEPSPVPAPTTFPLAPVPTSIRGCVSLDASSAGALDGNSASLSLVSSGGSDLGFDSSWMKQGFNVIVFSAEGETSSTETYNTALSVVSSDSILADLQSVAPGSFVVVLAKGSTDTASTANVGEDLREYMGCRLGAASFGPLGYQDSYALAFVQPSNVLAEAASPTTFGSVTVSVTYGLLSLEAMSAGFADGNSASLSVSYGGVDLGFDTSWIARGLNVVVLGAQGQVVSSTNYDILLYEDAAAVMVADLEGVAEGSVVVILASDANNHWEKDHIGDDLRAYMRCLGSSEFETIEFRDSFAFIFVKEGTTPLAEAASAAGSGSVTVSVDEFLCDFDSAPAPAPAVVVAPSSVPAPTVNTIISGGGSVSTCDDLGWTNAAAVGSTDVCGSSIGNTGACSDLMSWAEASDFCVGVGARLCTVTELQADETSGTGCSLNRKLVWSAESCDGGYLLAPGSSRLTTEPSCETASLVFHARCCADVR